MAEPNVEELVKKRDVAGLIKALKYDPIDKLFSEHIRRKAAEALGGLGDQRAIRPLCRRFGDRVVRGAVSEAIQAILNQLTEEDRRKMARRLIEAFRSMDDKDEQRGLAMALAVIGKPAAEPLFRLTEHYSKDIRENAALALGEMGDTRAIRPLMRIVDKKILSTGGQRQRFSGG